MAALFGSKLPLGCLMAGGILLGGSAHATLLTFDELVATEAIFTTLEYQGVTFSSEHFHIHGRMTPQPNFADNGTSYIGYEAARGDVITMALSDGGLFNLLSLDLAEFYGAHVESRPDAQVATLIGTTAAGLILTHQLFLDEIRADGIGGVADFESFVIPNFSDLISVSFVGTLLNGESGGISIDNIDYVRASVPEPGALSLLALGLASLAAARRRRAQRAQA